MKTVNVVQFFVPYAFAFVSDFAEARFTAKFFFYQYLFIFVFHISLFAFTSLIDIKQLTLWLFFYYRT